MKCLFFLLKTLKFIFVVNVNSCLIPGRGTGARFLDLTNRPPLACRLVLQACALLEKRINMFIIISFLDMGPFLTMSAKKPKNYLTLVPKD